MNALKFFPHRRGPLWSLFVASAFALSGGMAVLPASAGIVWSGNFDTGDFRQWHASDDASKVTFWQVPSYGRPLQYGGQSSDQIGDGSLLSLTTSPTRGSRYSAKFTVRNGANGSEPKDCDNSVCTRRRTELTVQQTLPDYYNAIPYKSDRWVSFSVFIPADWAEGGSGFGPVVFQIKPLNEGSLGLSAALDFVIDSGRTWTINHRWSPDRDPSGQLPWQQQMFYSGSEGGAPYPRADNWPDGMKDFPDVAASHAALSSVRKGVWTDWVIRVRFDAAGSAAGGTGSLDVWKREDSDPWVKVLHILPKRTTRGGMTFDHGIGYNSPAGANNGGFGIKSGMYMDKSEVWGLSGDRVIYLGNVKVGDGSTLFTEMSHDGSMPGKDSVRPKPPEGLIVE